MTRRAYLGLALLVTTPALSQAISPMNPAPGPGSDDMATPPPVSGQAFSTAVGAEEMSNYLRGGVTFSSSYIDNLYPGNGKTISASTYSIMPTLELDQSRSRRHLTLSYSPGFTFYHPTSALNQVDQNARVGYRVRLTPHTTLNLGDGFQDSSTSFSPTASGVGGSVSGQATAIAPGIMAPFAKRLTNSADGEFTWQMSRNGMVGAAGTATTLHYPNPSEAQGLYDSNSRGGSAFFDARISARQYLGAAYEFAQILSYPPHAEGSTRIHSLLPFYSLYLTERLSLSVSGGLQNYRITETLLPATASWSPSITASLGWQGMHTSFAASHSQAVTSGGGLVGAYHSASENAAARWQMSRTWTAGIVVAYANNKSVSPLVSSGFGNGHSISGSASVEHPLSRQLGLEFEYDRLHQSYSGIPAISNNPDANRATVSLSWQLMRPLGQ